MTQDDLHSQLAALSSELKSEIRGAIGAAFHEGIKAALESEREHTQRAIDTAIAANRCDCPLAQSDHQHVRHLVGMISDLGDGDKARGIRMMRDNHVWCGRLRSRSEKIGIYATLVVVGLIMTGAVGAFWLGVRSHLGGGQ